MKLIAPDYFMRFQCSADRCNHTCCKGWEIDIDDDTLRKYKYIGGSLGKKLRENVDFENGCFRLLEGDRCPFLDENGLCEIITEKGEYVLCDICADHPRFRNFFDTRTEIGLGLCCESAAKLIIENPDRVRLVTLEEDEYEEEITLREKQAVDFRDGAVDILQRSMIHPEIRIAEFLDYTDSSLPEKSPREWADIFRALERLDRSWDKYLDLLSSADKLSLHDGMEFQQLAVYFAYRHLPQGFDDDMTSAHAAFTALSVYIISTIYSMTGSGDIEVLEDIARMYSGEIEYSQDNLDFINYYLNKQI